jgi:hypothetical protein
MKLRELFEKPVDRPIEGVIKADDDTGLRIEVDEYVLTNEVSKLLEDFLDIYANGTNNSGVWLSGFYGSGKSHLLKMLALLLENRTLDGKPVLDTFLEKATGNEMLRGYLRKAASVPARCILFNIDQKADVINKSQTDALLAVFVKVFDELRGYYGKLGHVAAFERDLDERGQLKAFRDSYHAIAGLPWERGREQAVLEARNISAAYAQVTGTPAESVGRILEKYRQDYKVSIEDFADQVNKYLLTLGPTHRLVFLVDEVGQYIADNSRLLLNLQTLAESLATRCRGRAWLVVTAQSDMSEMLGEMTERQRLDFSKIMGRFATRMKLTSTNVAEVIRRRLLAKREQGATAVGHIYTEQLNNFRTLFDFGDGSRSYHNYRDREDFVATYPFVPYQVELFQAAIINLSAHDAFEGKHRSVGERSMLGVFQEAAKQVQDRELRALAPFDLLFNGIRTALKQSGTGSLYAAEIHLRDNPLALRLLKALYLVKYVREFTATARNLSVLMLDHFDTDWLALRKRVEEALNVLEQQSYIQRNGELYEYLTNEEKDVEV